MGPVHWLPRPWFHALLARTPYRRERLQLQTPQSLYRMLPPEATLRYWHHRIIAEPQRYRLTLPAWAGRLLAWLPGRLVHATRHWQPTLIATIRLRGRSPAADA